MRQGSLTERSMALALIITLCHIAAPFQLSSQTFQSVPAINTQECSSYLWITSCANITTNRISNNFIQTELSTTLFSETWKTAAHCIYVENPSEICHRSVSISTDPVWGRVIWGQSNNFLRSYGTLGTPDAGPGHFRTPRGVAITSLSGEWHVAYVADAGNDRVVVLALGYQCQCEKWIGTIDGSESGTPLSYPADVAWDPVQTFTMADDRIFIADRNNDRILVYQVAVDPVAGTMVKTYLNSFGSSGTGSNQFLGPISIAVRSQRNSWLYTYVYVADAGNNRIVEWEYDLNVGSGYPTSTPGTATLLNATTPVSGALFTGVSLDAFGDLIVTDQANQKIVHYAAGIGSTPPTFLAQWGAQPTWAAGNFVQPSAASVIYSYTQGTGFNDLITTGLPFVQTTEQWGDTTGIQLHQLGIDANNLAVAPDQIGGATVSWLLTAQGQYTVFFKDQNGTIVRTLPTTVAISGWKSTYWDGKSDGGVPLTGTFVAWVSTESGYTYDDGQPRYVFSAPFQLAGSPPPPTVTISGPSSVKPSTMCAWTANASGGTPGYTYAWNVGGTPVGGNSSTVDYTNSGASFTITVRVTDAASQIANASKSVTVSSGAPVCRS